MAVYRLEPGEPAFPDPRLAEPMGLVAVGGELRPEWLITAYALGIFPWPHEDMPLLWWSPDPRAVLELDGLAVSRSLAKTIRRGRYAVRYDTAFERVIRGCASHPRPRQGGGTWITPELVAAYERLHGLGFAHSVESWEGDVLAGGLYGVSLGGCFFGESMFADRPDASKVALAHLVARLRGWEFELLDCQTETPHLLRMGAHPIRREEFLRRLDRALERPTRRGPWTESGG